jgi:hypothetical protein
MGPASLPLSSPFTLTLVLPKPGAAIFFNNQPLCNVSIHESVPLNFHILKLWNLSLYTFVHLALCFPRPNVSALVYFAVLPRYMLIYSPNLL